MTTNLAAVLGPLVSDAPQLGPAEPTDTRLIRAALRQVTRQNGRAYCLLLILTTVLLILAVALIVTWATEPAKAAAVLGVSGISIPWLLRFIRDLWQTKVQSDTLLVLAETLDPNVVMSITKAFIKGVSPTAKNMGKGNASRSTRSVQA